MNTHTYQPLLFNRALIHSAYKDGMFIYELNNNNMDINNSSSPYFDVTLIPSSRTEWILGFNISNDDASFYCIGPVTRRRSCTLKNYEYYFGVSFDDNGCYFAKGVDDNTYPADMVNETYEYTPSPDSYERKLIECFRTTDDFNIRISMFDDFLQVSKKYCPVPDIMLELTGIIKQSAGNIHVSALASELGYSERHILRMFNATLGMSPKDYCRIIRFHNVLSAMLSQNNRHNNNSSYITGSGYSDQAHFQREFKTFTGITPRQFIKTLE